MKRLLVIICVVILYSTHHAQIFQTHLPFLYSDAANLKAQLDISAIQQSNYEELVKIIKSDTRFKILTSEFFGEKQKAKLFIQSATPIGLEQFSTLLEHMGILKLFYNNELINSNQLIQKYKSIPIKEEAFTPSRLAK
jgi:hypothetical protein